MPLRQRHKGLHAKHVRRPNTPARHGDGPRRPAGRDALGRQGPVTIRPATRRTTTEWAPCVPDALGAPADANQIQIRQMDTASEGLPAAGHVAAMRPSTFARRGPRPTRTYATVGRVEASHTHHPSPLTKTACPRAKPHEASQRQRGCPQSLRMGLAHLKRCQALLRLRKLRPVGTRVEHDSGNLNGQRSGQKGRIRGGSLTLRTPSGGGGGSRSSELWKCEGVYKAQERKGGRARQQRPAALINVWPMRRARCGLGVHRCRSASHRMSVSTDAHTSPPDPPLRDRTQTAAATTRTPPKRTPGVRNELHHGTCAVLEHVPRAANETATDRQGQQHMRPQGTPQERRTRADEAHLGQSEDKEPVAGQLLLKLRRRRTLAGARAAGQNDSVRVVVLGAQQIG